MTDETNRPADETRRSANEKTEPAEKTVPAERAEPDEGLKKVSKLFDVRRVIGGIFVVYGLIVGAVGLFDTQSDIDKAQGVRINLWMGLGMLALGLLMLLWLKLNPTPPPRTEALERPDADG